jgi:Tfp pilus assembly protein PilP
MKEDQRRSIKSRAISFLLAFFFVISLNMTAFVSYSATNDAAKKTDTEKGFLYDPTDKTDPFRSFIAAREEQKKEEKRKRPRTYLETLELSQLDLIVIVVGKEGRWAMVRDSKGLGHVIKEGTPIGTNDGVVYRIGEGVVTIREVYKDFRGRTQFREIKKETPALR